MDNIVVDTNVWVTAGKLASEAETIEEADCIEACIDWTKDFLSGQKRLVVDTESKVFDEYMANISEGRYPSSNLYELYNGIWARFEPVEIQFDEFGYAILPLAISFHDPADRKFVALALACNPYAPIYNAADTDWAKEREQLWKRIGLTIRELCSQYIVMKLSAD